MPRYTCFAGAWLVVIGLAGGCERSGPAATSRPAASGPSVLLVTLDTTRADRLGCYGYEKAHTPTLDALAAGGIRFESALSHVPLTLPSHTTLLTGTYPPTSGIRVNGATVLAADQPTLGEAFQEHGYRTAAFISAWVLNSTFGLNRGFEHYDDHLGGEDSTGTLYEERRGDATCDLALAWLDEQPQVPFFLWVHLFDPHSPYVPPPPFNETVADPYDGEIAFADAELGRLTGWLDAHGCRDRTLIVVVADHGEAFQERGETEHGLFLYNTTMHVPLIFAMPGRLPPGKVVAGDVGLVDVAPTILDLLGWDPLPGAEGVSVRAALDGGAVTPHALYGETEYPRIGFGWAGLRSYTTQEWKYIAAPHPELYDRNVDPGELTNVIAENAPVAARLKGILDDMLAGMKKRTAASAKLDAAELRALQSLGYVGGGTPVAEEGESDQPRRDPKDMVHVFRGLARAQWLLQQRRYAEVVQALEPLAAESPESDELQRVLGEAYLNVGRYAEAEQAYRASLRTVPDNPQKLTRLGDALLRQGKLDEALQCFQRATEVSPDYAPPYNRLGAVYSRKRQLQQAYDAFRRYLDLEPQSPTAMNNLAGLLSQFGRNDEAIALARQALQTDAAFAPAHQLLWKLLAVTGRGGEALAALRAASEALPADIGLKRQLVVTLINGARPAAGAVEQALDVARDCCAREPQVPENFDALGMARAAAGDFAGAADAAQQAIALAQARGQMNLAGRIATRLQAYQAGRRP